MESNWNDLLTGEMLCFSLLGKAFYVYPERAWVQSLIDGQVFAEAPFAAGQPQVIAGLELLKAWSDKHRGGISDAAFDEMRAEYTRLFIGPGKVPVPPWESVYFSEERLTFQERTLQVREWYARYGLQADKLHHEPDDHIGLELEFIAHLAKAGLAALEQNDSAALEQALDAQRRFLSEHLLTWAFDCCAQVEAQSRDEFFRGIAMLTRGALKASARFLELSVPKGARA
jgi:putative dimethyl sulfoxide reductase chaperone